jgi:surface antigen
MYKIKILTLVTALSITGCTSDQMPSGQGIGGLLGGIAGGIAGNQFGGGSGNTIATIGGAMLGMYAGSMLGEHLSEGDREYYDTAQNEAYNMPVGEAIEWENPETGTSGTITTEREGRTSSGSYCREFQQTVTIGGETEKAYGTACQQQDGTWKITS